jgi:hypothetical protein
LFRNSCSKECAANSLRVFQGSPIALNSVTGLTNCLFELARGYEPETAPIVLEHCGRESPRTPRRRTMIFESRSRKL